MCKPESTQMSHGPLATAVNYTAAKADSYLAYGKKNSPLISYVSSRVEAPVAKAAALAQPFVQPAVLYVDGVLVATGENVSSTVTMAKSAAAASATKPAALVSGVYQKVVSTCDSAIEHYLPAPADDGDAVKYPAEFPWGTSLRGCATKLATRLPRRAATSVEYGRQTVLAAPSHARELVHSAAACASDNLQSTRALVESKALVVRDGVYAKFAQTCDQTKAVMYTTIETVNGKTTAAFSLVQAGVQTNVVVPISSAIVWADGKLGISSTLTSTQALLYRTFEPVLKSSLATALAEKTAQLSSSSASMTADARLMLQKQIDTILAMLQLSAKPVACEPVPVPVPESVEVPATAI